MDAALETIRAAMDPDASAEARAAGVSACRAILASLEPAPRKPEVNVTQLATMVGALRGLPPDQLLELAITRLRGALPAGTEIPPATPLKFHLVQIPPPRSTP